MILEDAFSRTHSSSFVSIEPSQPELQSLAECISKLYLYGKNKMHPPQTVLQLPY